MPRTCSIPVRILRKLPGSCGIHLSVWTLRYDCFFLHCTSGFMGLKIIRTKQYSSFMFSLQCCVSGRPESWKIQLEKWVDPAFILRRSLMESECNCTNAEMSTSMVPGQSKDTLILPFLTRSRKGKDYTYLYGKHVGTGSLTPHIDNAFDSRVDE